MKRFVFAMAALVLFGLSSCGVSGQGTDDVTRLTVRIDSPSSLSAKEYGILAVPPELVGGSVLISISGEGMESLENQIDVRSEQDVIEANFLVPNGPDRRLWVYAYGQGGVLLYTGHEHMDLDGTPVSVVVQMVPVQPGDTTPPIFSGLDFVEIFPPGQATLFWLEASDDVSPPSAITYLIYEAQSPGGQNFQTPTYVANPGETFFNVFNLTPGTTYYYVVRARDEAGNIDSNTVERAVQMP